MLLKSYTSVQALRAIAALSVVAFHVSENIERTSGEAVAGGLFRKGFAGVDLFFVVSGFIIVHTCRHYTGHPEALLPYFSRRFFRIFPLYWLSLAPLLGFLWLFPNSPLVNHWPELGPGAVVSTLLLLPGHNEVNAVSWTLSFEWFFYLLFALLIWSRKAWVVLGALAFASLLNGVMLRYEGVNSGTELWRFFFLSPLNLEFLIGATVAVLRARVRVNYPLGLVGAGLLVVWLGCPDEPWNLNRVWSLGPGAGLILFGVIRAEEKKQFQVPRWLRTLGDASYPLYLIHFPLLVFCNKMLVRYGILPIAARLAVDVLLITGMCWVSIRIHRRVELPLRNLTTRKANPSGEKKTDSVDSLPDRT